MSSHPGVRCDRCDAVAVSDVADRIVDEWSVVRLQRGKPFFDTGHLDLCPSCTDTIYSRMRRITESKLAEGV